MLKKLPQDIIVIPIDYFFVNTEFDIECYLVFEKYANTLNQEIKERKSRRQPFSSVDIAFILKTLIK